ncbi:SGNH/GDSL hydrolase family protein [Henriciella marina]|uniref:SGNH/GDSL hydrolase family protein n=1 Tax=Henriciella marina TaxID=453851 RepID=UPI000A00F6DA|nr:GDSL-type esterase/lipase family protein [Henriciella marina]
MFNLFRRSPKATEQKRKIAAIGDSIVYGRHDTINGGWVGLLRRELESRNKMSAVFNLGIGGDNTENLKSRLVAEVSARKVPTLIIGVGTNDSRLKVADDPRSSELALLDFQSNLNRILGDAQDMCQDVYLLGIPPVDESRTNPLGPYYYLNDNIQRFRSAAREVLASHHCVEIDAWDMLYGKAVYSDGVHLNEEGHRILFETVLKHLDIA